ncbi:hypothetical protein Fleli_1096 [Bernardetia litoralis DSM 6794]|uniref:Uncharacterized protein n=1 Tax=Bernardetia litoralis (strain ATCC 23117 / DSM 6794 / NBRC 15988 / NCIMB 1366 / Fx l1 / Sio-4) TaxID=880071 RepID=I4AHU9_BERLS|nr:hypothetical protein [Bernardetia litoralis]AFM03534.1 hypothetical protein Fleli_1096 [Bernardetia litoralis DSM 6794]
MKYLKKPHLPIFILFVLLSAFGYNEFIKEKYTKQEKMILIHGYEQNIGLKNIHLDLVYRLEQDAERNLLEQGSDSCAKENYSNFKHKIEKLEQIRIRTFDSCFNNKTTININDGNEDIFVPKINTPKIATAFYDYVDRVSKLDTMFARKYKDFVFEEGMNDEQINDFYFDTDDYLRAFHFARFEAQLSKMYYEDTKLLLRQNFVAPYGLKIEEAKDIPFIMPERNKKAKKNEYNISSITAFPFDKSARLIYPEGVTTSFDENGFIIIPKEYRTGRQKFQVKFPVGCDRDTIFNIDIDFEGIEKFYKNAAK